ncbi:MAG: hypothetical protein A7315_06410 [Candidatus Altiarchaeales archaeon WOR_SM1_79]|nr:MAG: hypothetical protein A7315_06410 [Candidatus Altiarchaeales archaeon WOR_SM1_79]
MYITHPLIKPDKVKLRQYQEKAVARAIEASTMVILPTGLGKTIIAAMVSAHRLKQFPDSKILFMAPTKPLALQHQKTYEDILNVDAGEMVTLTGRDPPEKRKEAWKEKRIIFATPQTVENDIMRGLDIGDISLIIFDEAHRAVGNYAYVYIASEYVKSAKNGLILGLTASPGSDSEKIKEVLNNLYIKQVEVKTEQDADVKPYVQRVKREWVRVDLPKEFMSIQERLNDMLAENLIKLGKQGYLADFDIFGINFFEKKEISKTAKERLLRINKRDLLKIRTRINAEIVSGMKSFNAATLIASAIKVQYACELLETQGISSLSKYLERLKTQRSKAVNLLFKDQRMQYVKVKADDMLRRGVEHPKLDKVVEVVKERISKNKDYRTIIFTQYRDSVDKIIEKLNDADILAREFIGQAVKGKQKGMTQKEQSDALDKFRAGEFGVLVATAVAEEGLDIPKVDSVIFYEPIPSDIRSIQRRGRTGRSDVGEVIILMAKNTRDEGYYWASVGKEKRMQGVVRGMRELENMKILGTYEKGAKTVGQQSIVSFKDKEDNKVKIYIDTRERGSDVMRFLRGFEDVNVEIRQLEVGDFILSDRVGVERKTLNDFLQSIIDHRLLQQSSELTRNFSIPIMILEGVEDIYSLRDIHPNAVRGALAALVTNFGISILPSRSSEDTANLLYTIAKREQIEEGRIIALRGEKRPMTLAERQQFVVESLPNVSAVLAKRLLEHFGSVHEVMNASEKELMEVEKIGEKKAHDIRKVVKGKYEGG